MGRILVRIALLLTGKELLGREGVKYTIEEIQRMFLKDMTEIAGGAVAFKE